MQNTNKKNRDFGLIIGAVLSLVSCYRYFYGLLGFLYFAAVGFILILISLLNPSILNTTRIYWEYLGAFLGKVNTTIILTLIYVFVFIPMGILLRLFGYQPLDKPKSSKTSTYWQIRDSMPISSPKNQF